MAAVGVGVHTHRGMNLPWTAQTRTSLFVVRVGVGLDVVAGAGAGADAGAGAGAGARSAPVQLTKTSLSWPAQNAQITPQMRMRAARHMHLTATLHRAESQKPAYSPARNMYRHRLICMTYGILLLEPSSLMGLFVLL